MSGKTVHSLSSVLAFGKYKGLTVAAVLKFNAPYIGWAANHLDWFDVDAEARKIGQVQINRDRHNRTTRMNAWAHGGNIAADAKTDAQKDRRRRIHIEHEERYAAGQALNENLEWVPTPPIQREQP